MNDDARQCQTYYDDMLIIFRSYLSTNFNSYRKMLKIFEGVEYDAYEGDMKF